MDWESGFSEIQTIYNEFSDVIPPTRQRSKWENDNIAGFFRGLFNQADAQDINAICELINSDAFSQFSLEQKQARLKDLSDEMYEKYVKPFLQHDLNCTNNNVNQVAGNSDGGSRASSAGSGSSNGLAKTLEKRDGGCLFCWNPEYPQFAHILAQKNRFLGNIGTLLERIGISDINAVQNGLSLCLNCHNLFNRLQVYVEADQDRLLVKFVNQTNGPSNLHPSRFHTRMRSARLFEPSKSHPEEDAVDHDGELRVVFVDDETKFLPSRAALELHKKACLIWRMAGGADEEELDEFDDFNDHFAPAVPSKDIMDRVREWTSNVTMVAEFEPEHALSP